MAEDYDDIEVMEMIKLILSFIFFTVAFAVVISTIRDMTGRQRLRLTKNIGYSIMCSVLAILLLIGFVLLF